VCGAAWLDLLEERKWRQARRGFEAVLSRYPEHPFSMSGLSLVHVAEGDLAGASKWAWDAWHTNTLVGAQGTLLCWVRYLAGEYEAALEMASQLRMGGGHGANAGMVEVLALLRSAQVAEQMERIEGIAGEFSQNQTLQGALGYAYARTKQTGKAWEILTWMEQMQAQRKRRDAYGLALIHLGLGNEQEAVRWLEQSYAEGSLWSLGFRSDPMLKVLRGDPRWEMLVRRIGAASASGGAVPLDFMAKAI